LKNEEVNGVVGGDENISFAQKKMFIVFWRGKKSKFYFFRSISTKIAFN